MHARLLRSADRLTVRDLGSANGTSVNGVRVSAAQLVDGDLLAFAGDQYRVSVAMGEVASSTTAALRAEEVVTARDTLPPQQDTQPRFSSAWKQRVEGLEKAAAADEAEGDDTGRSSSGTDQTLHSSVTAATAADLAIPEQLGTAMGRIEVRLLGAGADLVVTGGGSYVVGSGAAAALRVPHPSVSEAHARLIVSDVLGSAFIQAEGGETLKNGGKVEKTEPLADGDEVRLGDVVLKIALRRVE
jgi:predicted component of type VI protein secretion system